jgi:hypothetical protein
MNRFNSSCLPAQCATVLLLAGACTWYRPASAAPVPNQLGPIRPIHELLDLDLRGEQGWAIDISGNLAVVGAPFQNGGNALLFDLTTGQLLHRLRGSDVARSDLFGYTVAIDGDLVLVGSGQEPAAYVFDATTGLQLRKLRPSTNDYVRSVDLSAGRAVLGTPTADVPGVAGADKGVATVLNARTGALIKRIDGPLGAFKESFGRQVAIDGNTLAVSSPASFDHGELRVFDSSTGQLKWTYDYTQNGGKFIARDIEIDGDLLAVGVTRNTTTLSEVLIFNSTSGELVNRINTTVDNQPADYASTIGFSDGRVAVGVWGHEVNGIGHYVGAVHLFDALSGNLLGTVENPDPQSGDGFGFGLALQGPRMIVGAPSESSDRGIAYSYIIPEPSTVSMTFTFALILSMTYRSTQRHVARSE